MAVKVNMSANLFPRKRTDLFTLDWLLGFGDTYGMPLRVMMEVYGNPGIGKTTLSYYLSGKVRDSGKIVIADLELQADPIHIERNVSRAGFSGEVNIINEVNKKGERISHSDVITQLADSLIDKDVVSVILDSIGGYVAVAEENNDSIGDINIGRRAQEIGKFSRRIIQRLRVSSEPQICILLNHVHSVIGGYGFTTPGGVTKSFLSSVRLHLTQKEIVEDCTYVKCKTDKKRQGGKHKDEEGYVFIIPDYGVSPEMTWVMDCMALELAERSAGSVKIDGTSHGKISQMIDKAIYGSDPELFKVFRDLLVSHEKTLYDEATD